MSVCAVMLVKDEADIIEATVRHLAWHVDEILVADNMSGDGTAEILAELRRDGVPVSVCDDEEVGYYQAEKTTELAHRAGGLGHRWVIPCDADEIWYAPEGRPIRDWLDALGREHQFVKAAIYNHVATADDPPTFCSCQRENRFRPEDEEAEIEPCAECGGLATPDPTRRIGWRQRVPLDIRWGKVACRTRPDLSIHQGNHSASTQGIGATGYGLEIRHFPYRSADHFVRKAINGYAAYKATDLDEGVGAHWRVYGKAIEEGGPEAGHKWFYDAFWSPDPSKDDSLVYDPAPIQS